MRIAAFLALPVAAILTVIMPAPKAYAASALCYNQIAGSLPIVCLAPSPDTLFWDGKAAKTGGKFEDGKCYIFAQVAKGWEVQPDCNAEIFKGAQGTTRPIGASPDPNHKEECTGNGCDVVAKILNPIINFLAAAVGIVCAISFAVAGVQYSASQDDPSKVAAARSRIYNTLFGLGGFMGIWAFLQWIIPGGPF